MKWAVMTTAALGLAACASTEAPDPYAGEKPVNVSSEAPDPSPLASYNIPRGRCGMILWARSGADVVPIFRSVDVLEATMRIEGETVPLKLQSQEGPLRLGMRATQEFGGVTTTNANLTVTAKLAWGEAFPAGTYIKSGTVTVAGPDGWSRILPVAGIAGCKS